MRGFVALIGAFALVVSVAPTGGGADDGRVLFDGTWDGANSRVVWDDIHASYDGGTLTLVPGQGRRGTVARIALPAGGEAAIEAIHHRPLELGTTTTYGLAFKFPPGWKRPTDGWGCAIAQLGYPLLKYTNIGVFAEADYLGLEMHTGRIDWHGRSPSAENDATFDFYLQHKDRRGRLIPNSQFKTGVWHSLLIEIRWETGPTGFLRAWHHVEGESSWTQTVDLERIPTMQWGYGIDGNFMGPDGKDPSGDVGGLSDKVGAYRDDSPDPLVVYNDGLVLTTSEPLAAAKVGGPSFTPLMRRPRSRPVALRRPYALSFPVRGGVLPIRWSLANGNLPPGLRLSRRAGTVFGRATRTGSWRVTVMAQDARGVETLRTVTLRVQR